MGASTHDLFGDAGSAQPATPGSYGEAPRGHRLPASTRLGPVRLAVADLARSREYYEGVLGLRALAEDGATLSLGTHGREARPLVELHGQPGVRPAARGGRLGLYHFAILLPDRASLGRFVRHLADIGVRAGAADHLVSEAFYLHDPDGLGIEIYADRPRDSWRRMGRELLMATDPVDVEDLVRAAGGQPWEGMPAATVMGHVHLHVGDLASASDFYSEGIGLDRMVWRYPGALFLAAGGYHHHLGTNTWASPGARASTDGDARLLEWTIELPSRADVEATASSVEGRGGAVAREGDAGIVTRDPWGTAVRIRVAD
jgi:catechol 2,3-dioxygenase